MSAWNSLPCVAVCSHLGCFLRLLILEIPVLGDRRMPSSGILYANVLASFLLGLIVYLTKKFPVLSKRHQVDCWLTGLKTGLCGSLSSFSTIIMQEQALMDHSAENPSLNPTKWSNVQLAVFHIMLAYSSAYGFMHTFYPRQLPPPPKEMSDISQVSKYEDIEGDAIICVDEKNVRDGSENHEGGTTDIEEILSKTSNKGMVQDVGLYVNYAIWVIVIAVCFSITFTIQDELTVKMTRAILLAPVGAFLRWVLGMYLNGFLSGFFYCGTFVANVSACVMGKIMADNSQRMPEYVYYMIVNGICGCLSTMSTLIMELDTLPRGYSWVYGVVTHVVALGLIFIPFG